MLNPNQIEQSYQDFMKNLPASAHDGVFSIGLQFLYEQNLLETLPTCEEDSEDLSQYFHVVESPEKVTLFNDHFIVWIVPKMDEELAMTYVLIALNHPQKPHLEIVFTTHGVYNSPRYVLKVLQYFLSDVLETEATIISLEEHG